MKKKTKEHCTECGKELEITKEGAENWVKYSYPIIGRGDLVVMYDKYNSDGTRNLFTVYTCPDYYQLRKNIFGKQYVKKFTNHTRFCRK